MIRCVVITEDLNELYILKQYILQMPLHLEHIGTAGNSLAGLNLIKNQKPDVVFLDTQFNTRDEFERAKEIGRYTKIVLCTHGMLNQAKGYELNVIDYLLKPISFSAFKNAVQEIQYVLSQLPNPMEQMKNNYILVKQGRRGKLSKIDVPDIVFIKGMANYVSFFCLQKKILAYLSLKELEERLPLSVFIRVHKSYIVSVNYIQSIEHNQIAVTRQGIRIPIGPFYREAFLNRIKGSGYEF